MTVQKQSLPSFASTISVLTVVFCCVGFLRTELELNKQKKRINAIENYVGTNTPSNDPQLSENAPRKFYFCGKL